MSNSTYNSGGHGHTGGGGYTGGGGSTGGGHTGHGNGHWASSGGYGYTAGSTHDFAAHADHMLGQHTLAPNQEQYGGYAKLSEYSYVARSPITGLRPVIEQAIRDIAGSYGSVDAAIAAYGSKAKLESAIANKLTNLNDWANLDEEAQNEIMIQSGINFDAMTEAEREMTINHLQHSPLPFGEIEEVLSTSAVIDMGITHTLDKDKTEVEHLGDGIYKVTMISNNNNGSHTGHNLGSFKIDMNKYGREDLDGQYAVAVTSNSTYGSASSNNSNATGEPNNSPWYGNYNQTEDFVLNLSYSSPTYVSGLEISGSTSYATGTIKKIELQDADGEWHTVWTGSEASTTSTPLVSISFDATDFLTNEARVTIDGNNTTTYEAIDAVKLLAPPLNDDDGGGRFAQAKEIGNSMVTHTNDNDKLYLDQAARDVLYGNVDEMDYGHPDHTDGPNTGHSFVEHASHNYGAALIEDQASYGGHVYLNENYIVGRSTITGLKPVVEQAIDQVKAKSPNLTGEALERAVAQQITNLNDWDALTEATQAKMMIMTGINFDAMTAAQQEMTINHLLHSPLPFGDIQDVLSESVKIDLGYTHTLDKDKTTSEHLGDGIYKVTMISNNNNGSHTGHNLGSFKLDLSGYPSEANDGQYAIATSSNSTYGTDSSANGEPDSSPWYGSSANAGTMVLTMTYSSATKVNGLDIYGTTSYPTGDVKKIELKDTDGNWHTVWTGTASSTTANPKLTIGFDATEFNARDARITIDSNGQSTWEAVDAVKLLTAPANGDDGSGREAKAIELANKMVANTNDNTKLYLDQAAREILHGNTEYSDYGVDNPYQPQSYGYNHIYGTSGNDLIISTDANDHIHADAGVDVIIGSAGNDVILGSANDYTQVNYAGNRADYTFTQSANGSVTVTKPNGTDTVSNIAGVVFTGENVWYSIEQLLNSGTGGGENPHNATILGTDDDDYLWGTDGDDVIDLRDGVDVVEGGKGDDVIYGGDADDDNYNQVNYDGSASDYKFSVNADGTVTVQKPDGTDTLHNFQGLFFVGEGQWYSPAQAAAAYPIEGGGGGGGEEPTIEGTEGDDVLHGTDGDDVIAAKGGSDEIFGSAGDDTINGGGDEVDQIDYQGSSSEYTFTKNEDGSINVVKPDGTDTLSNVDNVFFFGDEVWSTIADLIEGGGTGGETPTDGDDVFHGTDGDDTIDGLAGNDEFFGSAGNDKLDGGGEEYDQINFFGSSSEYEFTKNDDGSFTVTSEEGGTDLLTDIEGVYFFGDEVYSEIDDLV